MNPLQTTPKDSLEWALLGLFEPDWEVLAAVLICKRASDSGGLSPMCYAQTVKEECRRGTLERFAKALEKAHGGAT